MANGGQGVRGLTLLYHEYVIYLLGLAHAVTNGVLRGAMKPTNR